MYQLKTRLNDKDVLEFIHAIDDGQKRDDCLRLIDIMAALTGDPPRMWGESIVGFGEYQYTYESGGGGTWFRTGFSPRKQSISIYIIPGISFVSESLDGLGRYKTGKSCLYVKRLDDIDEGILKDLISESIGKLTEFFPEGST